MNNISLYLKESYNELINKVSWPSLTELLGATKIVIIASIIFTIIVLIIDLISKSSTNLFYGINV